MKNAPALPLQQHATFATALRLMGRHVQSIDLTGFVPTQTIRRFGITFAPRGPVWPDSTAEDDKVIQLRASPLRIMNAEMPGDAPRRAGFRQIMTPVHVAELSLAGTPSERLARTRSKWRNAYRKAQSQKLKVKHDTFDAPLHQWLLDKDKAQQRAKGFKALPHQVVLAYAASSPKDVVVFTAHLKHDVVAAMLFFCHAPVATYHLGWTNPIGRKMAAHNALLMQAADQFASEGLSRLDLGTVDTENAPGLARFKIGSGANVRPLGGTWLRIPGF